METILLAGKECGAVFLNLCEPEIKTYFNLCYCNYKDLRIYESHDPPHCPTG